MEEIAKNVFYIRGNTNIGVVCNEKPDCMELYLLDSGGSEKDAEIIFQDISSHFSILNKAFTVKAIYNTHSHSDHISGNKLFYDKYKCHIYTSFFEKGSMENNLLQPAFIWGGYPVKPVDISYYRAPYAPVAGLFDEETVVKLENGITLTFKNLPGHYFENYGIIVTTKDFNGNDCKVIFTGDAFFPREELAKYWIPFMIDPNAFMDSLDKLEKMEGQFKLFVPGHGGPVKEISETLELNRISVLSTKQSILNALKKGAETTENIIKAVADQNEMNMKPGQFILVGSVIRSYLACLQQEKKIQCYTEGNLLFWKTI